MIKYKIFINWQKDKIMDDTTYYSNEKPGKGTYLCSKCKAKVVIDDKNEKLSKCPVCNYTFCNKEES